MLGEYGIKLFPVINILIGNQIKSYIYIYIKNLNNTEEDV